MTNTHHKAKKSMGQNFLKSESALQAMCDAAQIRKSDTILEIGPGKGALTTKLLERAERVIAVEKDRDLIDILKEKFEVEINSGQLVLVQGDVLQFDPKDYDLEKSTYKIVANIPYNITGAIIKKFLSSDVQPSQMTLLVQKEVAMRIVARDEKESILSLSVKAYGEPKYIMKVSKRFFSPEPKVDSAIVDISNISRRNFNSPLEEYPKGEVDALEYSTSALRATPQEGNLFKVLHAAFAHKRKFVKKNLESLGLTSSELDALFMKMNIDPKARAEDLTIKTWLELAQHIG